jgi:hypothetical protein
MHYIKLTDGVPDRYTLLQLRRDNPTVSFPAEPTEELLASWDVYPYARVEKLTCDHATEVCEKQGYVATNGVYGEAYVVRNKTQAELDADVVEAAEYEAERVQSIKADFDHRNSVSKVLLKISFLQENRIRSLEGKPNLTVEQFRNWVDNQIG